MYLQKSTLLKENRLLNIQKSRPMVLIFLQTKVQHKIMRELCSPCVTNWGQTSTCKQRGKTEMWYLGISLCRMGECRKTAPSRSYHPQPITRVNVSSIVWGCAHNIRIDGSSNENMWCSILLSVFMANVPSIQVRHCQWSWSSVFHFCGIIYKHLQVQHWSRWELRARME